MISLLDHKRRLLAMPGYYKGDQAANEGMNEAALMQAKTGAEGLKWFQEEYARTAPERDAATARAKEISDEQLATLRQQRDLAQDYYDYSKSTFRPLEQRMVREAGEYDTPARREAAAAEAAADVQRAADTQAGVMTRNLMRSGVNPASGANLDLQQQASLATAKMSAGAQNAARKQVETTGYARMADAANLGRGLPSAQATAVQTGVQAGQASAASSQAALGAAQSGSDLMGKGYDTAMSGYRGAGQLYSQMAANSASESAGQWGALGSMAGSALGAYGTYLGYAALAASDENVKKKTGKKANTARMLQEVEDVPVDEDWEYDPTKGGPDDGGQPHDGPMAQDVQRVMGDDVAPGGKAIDLVTMNGKTMGAVQELAKRVKRIEARMSK